MNQSHASPHRLGHCASPTDVENSLLDERELRSKPKSSLRYLRVYLLAILMALLFSGWIPQPMLEQAFSQLPSGLNEPLATVVHALTPTVKPALAQTGSITIINDTNPDDDQDFVFDTSIVLTPTVTLDDDGNAGNVRSNQAAMTGLSAGTYVFTETTVSGWLLSDIVVSGATDSVISIGTDGSNGNSTFDAGDNVISIDLAAGEDVTITFTNKAEPCTGHSFLVNNSMNLSGVSIAGQTIAASEDTAQLIIHTCEWDYGDLPDNDGTTNPNGPEYNTDETGATLGASHIITPGLSIGATIDDETDGQSSTNAAGDGSDEDGITIPTFYRGQSADITVSVINTTGNTAYVYGYIDWNGDGAFTGPSEAVNATVNSNGGTAQDVTLTFNVPSTTDVDQDLGARFRLNSEPLSSPDGEGRYGEVEDYLVTVEPLMFLGNRVWYDVDNNGTLDVGESGIDSVAVELYYDTDSNDVFSAGDTRVASATTANGGYYTFTNLLPNVGGIDDYVVVITDTNFSGAGVLVDYISSDNTSNNPNDNTDDDDNGIVNSTLGVVASGDVDLTDNSEPSTTTDSGDSNWTVDFGFYKLTLGNYVWEDLNNDGDFDAGEPAISGVAVALVNDDGDVVATDTTDGSGLYSFTGIVSDTYVVSVTAPSGYRSSVTDAGDPDTDTDNNDDNGIGNATGTVVSHPINLTPGSNSNGSTVTSADGTTVNNLVDFGLYRLASLGDTVWYDTDADGIQDGAEQGIQNVTVRLLNSGGTTLATDTTNASGNYSFDNLDPGTYRVEFVAPANYQPSPQNAGSDDAADSDASVTTGRTALTTLISNEDDTTWDAGFYQITLGNLVWDDLDNDGDLDTGDGEAGISGVAVALVDTADNSVAATTTTDGDGYYTFTGVISGTYVVSVTAPSGYVSSGTDAGDPDTDIDDDDDNGLGNLGGEVVSNPISLIAGDTGNGATVSNSDGTTVNTLVDFGLYSATAIGDFVWYDVDADGVQDADEIGVADVTVWLRQSGSRILTTTTNISGEYSFTGLNPGLYDVEFDLPAGYQFSPRDAAGDNDIDSDVDPADNTTALTFLSSGENDLSWDAGIYQIELGNRVWDDLDNDGMLDAGESGISGVEVALVDTTGNSVVMTTTTDSDGYYTFTGVISNTYVVSITAPTDYYSSGTDAGDPDVDTDDNDDNGIGNGTGGVTREIVSDPISLFSGSTANGSTVVTTTATTTNLLVDFGLYQKASIGDTVWYDTDGDGVQDGNEEGIQGVTVRLLSSTGTTLDTDTTDVDGTYSFTDLDPDTYRVEFVAPADYQPSPRNAGSDDTADSDASVTTGQTINTVLVSGENDITWDAGFYQITLGNQVWEDIDNDGTLDGGESGISGVAVALVDTADGTVVDTDTTDGSGFYNFTGVVSGTYVVSITAPSGYLSSGTDAGDPDTDTDNSDDNGIGNAGGEIVSDPITLTAGNAGNGSTVTDADGTTVNNLVDFGIYQQASLGDTVWYDTNGDGIQDGNEEGIQGVTVRLLNSGGATLATDITDADGNYDFSNLDPGSYRVEFVAPADYQPSPQNVGSDDTADSDASVTTGRTALTTLISGENDTTWDAGFYQITLGNQVWEDTDNDGELDGGESGISGIAVALVDTADGTVVDTDTTDGSGNYNFTGVVSGTYVVSITAPSGYYSSGSADNDQDIDTDDGDDNGLGNGDGGITREIVSAPISLTAGNAGNGSTVTDADGTTVNNLVDFGLYQKATIGDLVWNDENQDGIKDGSEDGLEDVVVNLYLSDGTFVISTTTDVNGGYSFTDLDPEDYYIVFEQPQYWSPSPQDVGSNSLDSDADITTGETITTTLVSGETDNTWDAGFYLKAAGLTPTKTLVLPADGIAKPGDTVTFTLQVENTGLMTVTEVNLTDVYDTRFLEFSSSDVTPTNHDVGTGTITWSGTDTSGALQPQLSLAPGESFTITVEFTVKEP